MGVEFFPCDICGESICDCGFYESCSNCEVSVCEECYEEQKEKYGLVVDKDKREYFGGDALLECDCCSKKNKKERIKKLEEQLKKEREN